MKGWPALRRKLAHVMGASIIGVVGTFAAVEPAAAAGATCPYPYVCFFSGYPGEPGSVITGKFKVVTSGYQPITGTSTHSDCVQNTRHDVAYIRFSDGKVVCIWPESGYGTDNDLIQRYINGVRISWSPTC